MPTRRRFLWITDPWNTLDHANDTTLRLAQEAVAQGHHSFHCDVRRLRLEGTTLRAEVSTLQDGHLKPVSWPKAGLAHFDSWHYRVDPPVDLAYTHPLQLLCLHERASERLVNPPSVLFQLNEKLGPPRLRASFAPSLVSSQLEVLEAFIRSHRVAVLKPLHFAQSRGVDKIASSDSADDRLRKLTEATDGFTRPVMLQQFLNGIEKGEQRLWFLDGKLLAHVTKHPLEGDFRVNLDQGSRLSIRPLSAQERAVGSRVGRELKRLGARLAAVDLVEGRIIDFNTTSPGLLVAMERITGKNLARPIIQALARRR